MADTVVSMSNPNTNTHGGRRPGSGRVRLRYTLDPETARILREVTRQWRAEHPQAKWTAPLVLAECVWRQAGALGLLSADPAKRDHWRAVASGETPEP